MGARRRNERWKRDQDRVRDRETEAMRQSKAAVVLSLRDTERNMKLEATAAGAPQEARLLGQRKGNSVLAFGARSKVCCLHSALVPPLIIGSARPSFRNIRGLQ